ncbi:Trypsin-like protein, partial [Operophtera brumata]
HERYNAPVVRDNDVAVMLLASSARLGASIAVARIPAQGEEVPDNMPVIHVGWGRTNPNVASASQTLQEVEIRTVDFTTCRDQYRMLEALTNRSFPVTTNMICSGLLGVGGTSQTVKEM